MRPSWFGYYAGVACGILGDLDQAASFLRGITDERVIPRGERFLPAIGSPIAFRKKTNEIVNQKRAALKLPTLTRKLF
jgi:hypothetical protein